MLEKIKYWYKKGLWSESMLKEAVTFNVITQKDLNLILQEDKKNVRGEAEI